ncbi:MAG: mannose-6-phosphate isomerase, class I, partial [Rothia mucilaginosa]|nr:mannose-6-phosphate isomerase, class I [Rothia mucilaginosa]
MGEIFSLKNQIQNYAWGSREILGRMRGVPVPTEQPEAEVWVGAHPAAPSRATVDGTESPLNELIVENPSRFLRPDRISDWFPFLFKILAIDAPLSIQVHPTPEQAIAGFEDEQARGIAIDAPHRNYKDRYSKPETVIALTQMRVLTGVRTSEQLAELAKAFKADWLAERVELTPKQLLTEIIRMPEDAAATAVEQLVEVAAQLT